MRIFIKLFFCALAAAVLMPVFANAAIVGEVANFTIADNFDALARDRVAAELVKSTAGLYFYVEKSWWDAQPPARQSEILSNFDALAGEFDNHIYPTLTSVYGSEWKPGVDSDSKITVLFHAMKEGAAGYFRSADEYIKLQLPTSNEREMVYLSLANITSSQLKVFLAHEFTHLIEFNQKERLYGAKEEVWLSEARADFSSTILGYDSVYEGSNLQRRVRDFLNSPSDSLTEWRESKYDYAVVSVFMHYLVDHYGIHILADSMKTKLAGIASVNAALASNSIKEDFGSIFTDWTIALMLNDCSLDLVYCYLNPNLKNLRLSPTLNFLPLAGNSSLTVANVTKNWAGNWQKVIGGRGDLTLEFSSLAGLNFRVPYLIFDKNNNYTIHVLALDRNQQGKIEIKNFGGQFSSLIIVPSLQSKTAGFNGLELTYPYSFEVSISGDVPDEEAALIQQLLAQIELLRQQIARLQGGLPGQGQNLCQSLTVNLYVGVGNASAVRCLQQFLKNQGSDIYPEGLVTGYFGQLTKSAVVRFQRKHDIPSTGFVGPLTRTKINQML